MSGIEKQLVREARPWYFDLTELAAFLRWMIETARLHGNQPWDLVEKPWHFEAEHETFLRELELERLTDEMEAHEDYQRRSAL